MGFFAKIVLTSLTMHAIDYGATKASAVLKKYREERKMRALLNTESARAWTEYNG